MRYKFACPACGSHTRAEALTHRAEIEVTESKRWSASRMYVRRREPGAPCAAFSVAHPNAPRPLRLTYEREQKAAQHLEDVADKGELDYGTCVCT